MGCGAWAAETGGMLLAGSSHRLRGADRIQGLEQLRELGSSKRQMVLDGSQGRVSGVGNRSQSNPGQGRGNQAEAGGGGGGGFLPSPFPEREGGSGPCPSSQEWQLTARAGHGCSDSSVAFARHVPGKFPWYPSRAAGFKVLVTHRVLQLHMSLVPMCACVPTGVHTPGVLIILIILGVGGEPRDQRLHPMSLHVSCIP